MSTIPASLVSMREYFETGATHSYSFRKQQLVQLKNSVLKYQNELDQALYLDLKKSKEDVWLTETGMVISEIDYFLKGLSGFMKPKKVSTNLLNLPGKSFIQPEPLGVTLIIGPWNYPFQLLLLPLVGAIAAGNCVVLKPSEYATNTEKVVEKIINESFHFNYVRCITGEGSQIVPEMMQQFRFDHVFFTGGTTVGKIIYKMAAEQLTPVTLELGGKSPCIITENANLKVAARRIASIKFSNAGQMCIAPDYLLVHHSVADSFINHLKNAIETFYTANPLESYDFGRIVNKTQFRRLLGYMNSGEVIYGGEHNEDQLYIAPTLIKNVLGSDDIMQQEIFGPLLPILKYNTRAEAMETIKQNPNPLAFYIFTNKTREAEEWMQTVPSGNASVNVAALFYLNKNLPFGGRGNSGMGRYHGKFSFDTFSHQKAVLKRPARPDFALAYPSFKGKLRILKKFI